MPEPLFVYGTLRAPAIVEKLLGRRPGSTPALLRGWRCEFVRAQPFPGIAPDEHAVVEGELFADLSESAMARLDRYEGDLYERVIVRVELRDGSQRRAETYALRAEHRARLDGRRWELTAFLRTLGPETS